MLDNWQLEKMLLAVKANLAAGCTNSAKKYNHSFSLKTLPPWQPLCKHFVTGQTNVRYRQAGPARAAC